MLPDCLFEMLVMLPDCLFEMLFVCTSPPARSHLVLFTLASPSFLLSFQLFGNMSNFMKKPNIIVHLDLTPEESIRRIKMRNRDCEAGISLEYMQSLHAAYEAFIADIARVIPVIKVDYSRFRTAEEMAVMIKHEYTQIANIRHVSVNSNSYSSQLPPAPPADKTTKPLVQTAAEQEGVAGEKSTAGMQKPSIAVNKEAEFDRYADIVSS
jgi:hypothetical protein